MNPAWQCPQFVWRNYWQRRHCLTWPKVQRFLYQWRLSNLLYVWTVSSLFYAMLKCSPLFFIAPTNFQESFEMAVSILKHHCSKRGGPTSAPYSLPPVTSSSRLSFPKWILKSATILTLPSGSSILLFVVIFAFPSYVTTIHIICHSRLKSEAKLNSVSFRKFPEVHQPISLARLPFLISWSKLVGPMVDGSAPFIFNLLIKACLESKKNDQGLGLESWSPRMCF